MAPVAETGVQTLSAIRAMKKPPASKGQSRKKVKQQGAAQERRAPVVAVERNQQQGEEAAKAQQQAIPENKRAIQRAMLDSRLRRSMANSTRQRIITRTRVTDRIRKGKVPGEGAIPRKRQVVASRNLAHSPLFRPVLEIRRALVSLRRAA